MTEHQVDSRISEINTKLDALEQQRNLNEKLEKTRDLVQDMRDRVSRMEGAVGFVTLIFVVLSGLGAWKLYQYDKFEAARDKVYELLVSQIQEQTSDAINKLSVTAGTVEDKERVIGLVKMQQRLTDLEISSDSFIAVRDLIKALEFFIVDGQDERADEKLKMLESRHTDKFMLSRIYVLRALIQISRNRNGVSEDTKKWLTRAIEMDSTLAPAFNGLGIQKSNEAQAQLRLETPDLKAAIELMRQAEIYYSIAARLHYSALGTIKYFNNRTWSNLLLLKAYLDHHHGKPEGQEYLTELLRFFGKNNEVDFLADSLKELETYEAGLPPHLRLSYVDETKAQLRCVYAQYLRLQGDESAAAEQLLQAQKLFESAIDKGVYLYLGTADKAIEAFDDDPLHTIVKGNKHIHNRIKEWFRKQGQK